MWIALSLFLMPSGTFSPISIFPINPTSKGVSISSHARGGGIWYPPLKIKERLVLGLILLYISWTYLKIEFTCQKLGKNFKNWARFRDFKILRNWDFAPPWLTETAITRSIFEIESSSFGFSLICMCFKIHVLHLRLYDQFFNNLNFYTPLPKGGRVKNLNSYYVQKFSV